MSPFCIAVCKKFLPLLSYCSAALGNLSNIACAALLLRTVRAVAKGDSPFLSLLFRSIFGWHSRREIICECWFCIATCTGVFPSASRAFTSAPCSISVWTTCSSPHWQHKCNGVHSSLASSPPAPSGPGRLGAFKSHPLQNNKSFKKKVKHNVCNYLNNFFL